MGERSDWEREFAAAERDRAATRRRFAELADSLEQRRAHEQAAFFHEEAAKLHDHMAAVYEREDATPSTAN